MRAKGSAKTPGSGRKAGVQNKRTKECLRIMDEQNFCPVREAIEAYRMAINQFKIEVKKEMARAKEKNFKKRRLLPWPDPMRFKYLEMAGKQAEKMMQYHSPKRKAISLEDGDGNDLVQAFTDLTRQAAQAFDQSMKKGR